jgi:hypothetical protein
MPNRTAKPIHPRDTELYAHLSKQSGKGVRAVLGNENGVVIVPNNTNVTGDTSGWSYYYARWIEGIDEDKNTVLGETFRFRQGQAAYIPNRAGGYVWVKQDPNGSGMVAISVDDRSMIAAGIDPRQFNTGLGSKQQLVFRNMQNGRVITHSESTGNETKVTIQDLVYIYNGQVKNAVRGLSNGVELSSYIPSDVTKEVLIALGLKPQDNTIEVVASAESTITTNSITMSELTTLFALHSQDIIALEVLRVQGGTTALLPRHRELGVDWRQILNVPNSSEWPVILNADRTLYANTQIVLDELTITSGVTLTIEATAILKVI